MLDAVAPRLVDVGVSRWLLPLELVDQVRLAAAEVFDLRRELLPAPRSQRTYLLRSSVRCDLYYIDVHTGNIPTERPGPNSPKPRSRAIWNTSRSSIVRNNARGRPNRAAYRSLAVLVLSRH